MNALTSTFTTREVADALRCNERTVASYVKRGLVTPMRLGDRLNAPMRFTQDDVEQLRSALTPPPQRRPPRPRRT